METQEVQSEATEKKKRALKFPFQLQTLRNNNSLGFFAFSILEKATQKDTNSAEDSNFLMRHEIQSEGSVANESPDVTVHVRTSLEGVITFVAGGCAGAVSRTVTAPFDRLKVLLQIQIRDSEYTGIYQGLRKIYTDGGWRGFYRGNGTNVVKTAPELAIKFWAFEATKGIISTDIKQVTLVEKFIAGSSAGIVSQIAIYPLEITKTRLAIAAPGTYTGILDCLFKIVQFEGPRALYKGLVPSLAGIVPYSGVDLAVYFTLKDWRTQKNGGKTPSAATLLTCGAISSTTGQLLTYPLALVRTRLQAQGMNNRNALLYSGMIDCIKQTVRREGFFGLYKGIGPNFLKAIPAVSISYLVYENTKSFLEKFSGF